MPKIEIAAVPERKGTGYPPQFNAPCAERVRQRLGDAGGLTDFGVNLMRLPPGNWSSERHWHWREDEFIFVLQGEVVKYSGNMLFLRHMGAVVPIKIDKNTSIDDKSILKEALQGKY